MNRKNKKPVSMRLSENTIAELASIAKRHGVSQAEVVAYLVHGYYMNVDESEIEAWLDMARI